MTISDIRPLDAVVRLRDAMNAHDAHAVAACFTPDYRCECPTHPDLGFTGSDQVLRNWTGLLARLPDLRADVLRTAVNGDEVWTEWEQSGTDAAGERTTFRGVVILTLRDGLIDWTRFCLDPVTQADRRDPVDRARARLPWWYVTLQGVALLAWLLMPPLSRLFPTTNVYAALGWPAAIVLVALAALRRRLRSPESGGAVGGAHRWTLRAFALLAVALVGALIVNLLARASLIGPAVAVAALLAAAWVAFQLQEG